MIAARLKERGADDWGAGHFGASRGGRPHTGIDYSAEPGAEILSPVWGTVTKLGYCYGDDLSYRYVQVTDAQGLAHRVFYVAPTVAPGQKVGPQTVIGTAQDIAARYPATEERGPMTNHVHYEIKNGDDYLNPDVHAV